MGLNEDVITLAKVEHGMVVSVELWGQVAADLTCRNVREAI